MENLTAITNKGKDSGPNFFLRQERTKFWDQSIINEQVALILGVGGVGTSCAMDVVRMGFKKIFLVDRDVVEYHNLNRQLLFSKEDIGKSKVVSAAKCLQQHNLRTEIVPIHMDAVKEWSKVVELAKQSTCIFNGIDYGDYWDFAVCSLGLKIGIPTVLGGTDPVVGMMCTIDYVSGKGKPCWACMTDLPNKDIKEKLTKNLIDTYKDISFIPEDSKYSTGGSMIFSASTCGHLMATVITQDLLQFEKKLDQKIPNRLIFSLVNFESFKWDMESNPNCILCGENTPT